MAASTSTSPTDVDLLAAAASAQQPLLSNSQRGPVVRQHPRATGIGHEGSATAAQQRSAGVAPVSTPAPGAGSGSNGAASAAHTTVPVSVSQPGLKRPRPSAKRGGAAGAGSATPAASGRHKRPRLAEEPNQGQPPLSLVAAPIAAGAGAAVPTSTSTSTSTSTPTPVGAVAPAAQPAVSNAAKRGATPQPLASTIGPTSLPILPTRIVPSLHPSGPVATGAAATTATPSAGVAGDGGVSGGANGTHTGAAAGAGAGAGAGADSSGGASSAGGSAGVGSTSGTRGAGGAIVGVRPDLAPHTILAASSASQLVQSARARLLRAEAQDAVLTEEQELMDVQRQQRLAKAKGNGNYDSYLNKEVQRLDIPLQRILVGSFGRPGLFMALRHTAKRGLTDDCLLSRAQGVPKWVLFLRAVIYRLLRLLPRSDPAHTMFHGAAFRTWMEPLTSAERVNHIVTEMNRMVGVLRGGETLVLPPDFLFAISGDATMKNIGMMVCEQCGGVHTWRTCRKCYQNKRRLEAEKQLSFKQQRHASLNGQRRDTRRGGGASAGEGASASAGASASPSAAAVVAAAAAAAAAAGGGGGAADTNGAGSCGGGGGVTLRKRPAPADGNTATAPGDPSTGSAAGDGGSNVARGAAGSAGAAPGDGAGSGGAGAGAGAGSAVAGGSAGAGADSGVGAGADADGGAGAGDSAGPGAGSGVVEQTTGKQ